MPVLGVPAAFPIPQLQVEILVNEILGRIR
jgi:hypothetical protein